MIVYVIGISALATIGAVIGLFVMLDKANKRLAWMERRYSVLQENLEITNELAHEANEKARLEVHNAFSELNDEYSALRENAVELSLRFLGVKKDFEAGACGKEIDKLQKQVRALQEAFEEVVVDEVNERAKGEKLFNEGLANIMNYGVEIPALNKGAVNNGD